MAEIRKDFKGVVHIYVSGESVFLRAGESVPEGVSVPDKVLAETKAESAKAISEKIMKQEAPKDETPKGDDPKQPESNNDDGMPADGDSREAWNIYAESVGVDPAPFSKKDALIEALKNR